MTNKFTWLLLLIFPLALRATAQPWPSDAPRTSPQPPTLVALSAPTLPCGQQIEGATVHTDWHDTAVNKAPVLVFPTGGATALLNFLQHITPAQRAAYGMVMIRNPSAEDLAQLSAPEFIYGPMGVTWIQPWAPMNERYPHQDRPRHSYIDIDKRKSYGEWNRRIKAADKFGFEIIRAPMTAENLLLFYNAAYRPFMIEKLAAIAADNVEGLKFFEMRAEKIAQGRQYEILILKGYPTKAQTTGEKQIIGGAILEWDPHTKTLKIDKVALDTTSGDLKGANLASRNQEEIFLIAEKLGAKFVSYGTDTAGYGPLGLSVAGLAEQKAQALFQATYRPGEFAGTYQTRVFAILNLDLVGSPYVTFSFRDKASANPEAQNLIPLVVGEGYDGARLRIIGSPDVLSVSHL